MLLRQVLLRRRHLLAIAICHAMDASEGPSATLATGLSAAPQIGVHHAAHRRLVGPRFVLHFVEDVVEFVQLRDDPARQPQLRVEQAAVVQGMHLPEAAGSPPPLRFSGWNGLILHCSSP